MAKKAARISLSDLAPPDVEVEYRGSVYMLPGEVPLITIVEAVHLQEGLESAKTVEEQTLVLERMYRIVMDLFRDRNPDVPDLRLTTSEVGWLIAFVASGGEMESLEEAIQSVVSARGASDDDDAEDGEGRAHPTGRKGRATPARRSRSASL